MRNYKSNIKKINDSGIIILVILIATLVSIANSITSFLMNNNHSKEIMNLESSIERLTPNSDKSGNIDLSYFFVCRNKIEPNIISKESIYEPNSHFYHSNSEYWNYKIMNPIEFIHFINQTRTSKDEFGIDDLKSHVWYSNLKFELNNPEYTNLIEKEDERYIISNSENATMFGYNKLPKELKQYIKLTTYNNKLSFLKTRESKNLDVIDSISFRDIGFKANISSFIDFIFDDLYSNYPYSISHTEISQMNLSEKWFFMSAVSVFGNKSIQYNVKKTVYVFNEWYIFHSEEFTYLLEIQTPSFEPTRRGDQFKELNLWLSNFKVIVS